MELIVTTREELASLVRTAVAEALLEIRPASPKPEVKYLTVKDAAKKAGVSRISFYRGIQKGEIPSKTFGRKLMIPSSFFEED